METAGTAVVALIATHVGMRAEATRRYVAGCRAHRRHTKSSITLNGFALLRLGAWCLQGCNSALKCKLGRILATFHPKLIMSLSVLALVGFATLDYMGHRQRVTSISIPLPFIV